MPVVLGRGPLGRGPERVMMASVRPRREFVTLPSMSSMCPTLVHTVDIELSKVATALRISLKSAVTDEWKERSSSLEAGARRARSAMSDILASLRRGRRNASL